MYGKTRAGLGLPALVDSEGKLITANGGGTLADAAINGRLFSVANQAKVAVTAALATTWTGLGVGNPSTSGKLYVLHEFGWSTDVVNPAEGVVGIMIGAVGDMAQAVVPRCARWGYATTVALTDDGATVGTPVLVRTFGSTMEGAITTAPQLAGNVYKIDGGIVIPPGYAALSYHSIGGTASMLFHYVWEEIDA